MRTNNKQIRYSGRQATLPRAKRYQQQCNIRNAPRMLDKNIKRGNTRWKNKAFNVAAIDMPIFASNQFDRETTKTFMPLSKIQSILDEEQSTTTTPTSTECFTPMCYSEPVLDVDIDSPMTSEVNISQLLLASMSETKSAEQTETKANQNKEDCLIMPTTEIHNSVTETKLSNLFGPKFLSFASRLRKSPSNTSKTAPESEKSLTNISKNEETNKETNSKICCTPPISNTSNEAAKESSATQVSSYFN